MTAPFAVEVLLPQWTMDMREGDVVRWLCRVGDAVSEGQDLVEVEAEKITATVAAPLAGVVTEVCVPTGGSAEVGETLCVLVPADPSDVAGTWRPPEAPPATDETPNVED